MKYIEELEFGDCFIHKDELFVLTSDFGSNNKNRCVCLKDGNSRWLNKDSIVEPQEIYILDHENNISPIKIRKSASA